MGWTFDFIPAVWLLRRVQRSPGHAAPLAAGIHATTPYTLTPETLRTARRHGLITVGGTGAVGLVDRLGVLLAVLAGLCALVRHPIRVSRGAVAAVARWLQRNLGLIGVVSGVRPFRPDAVCRWLPIPTLTARSLGKFRVVFGLALFYVVFTDPPSAQPLEMHRNYSCWRTGRSCTRWPRARRPALLHESSLARTMPTDRILTYRCGMTLVGRGRSSD